MTLKEYQYRMKAYALSRVDVEYDIHLSAWLNNIAGQTETKNKKQVPVFKTFKDFYDREGRENAINGKKEALPQRYINMARIAEQLNKKGG